MEELEISTKRICGIILTETSFIFKIDDICFVQETLVKVKSYPMILLIYHQRTSSTIYTKALQKNAVCDDGIVDLGHSLKRNVLRVLWFQKTNYKLREIT